MKSDKLARIPSDLLAAALLSIAVLLFTLTPLSNVPVVRIPLGLLMVLFVPGYTLIAALFPHRADLEGIERIAEERFSIRIRETARGWMAEFLEDNHSRVDRALTVILILTIIASVAALVYVIVTPKQGEKFTEFYILGPGGKAYDYPTNVLSGNRSTVIVGVVNHEYAPVNYTMRMVLNSTASRNYTPEQAWPRPEDLQILTQNLTMVHNETWERPVNYTLNRTGDFQKLEFLLYKEGNFTGSYRDLHLWVNVSRPPGGLRPQSSFSDRDVTT